MRIKKFILMMIVPVLLTGCNKQPSNKKHDDPEVNTAEKGKVILELDGIANTSRRDPYELTFEYNNSYFNHSASQFDRDLMLLSFASACVGCDKSTADYFFDEMFFDNSYAHGYERTDENTIAYYLAHKVVNESEDLIALTIRGANYDEEWANNFTIGASGNHQGFTARANEIYADLLEYVNQVSTNGFTTKVWLTGYSRAGGIANVLSDIILRDNSALVNVDTLYTYTFEAPAGILEENAVRYINVFNMINSRDLVTRIPPVEYGFKRCGIDFDIYLKDWEKEVKKFDDGIKIPTFTKNQLEYTNELEFIDWLMRELRKEVSDESARLTTRADYINNYQDHITYLLILFYLMPQSTSTKLMEYLEENPMEVFFAVYQEDGLYNIVEPILEEDNVAHSKFKLKAALNKFQLFFTSHTSLVSKFIGISGISTEMQNNMTRVLMMHYPEVTYALIAYPDDLLFEE